LRQVAAATRTLTEADLRRALLARQLLLRRSRLALPDALQRVGGLQSQYAPTMYIGLWSRIARFRRDDLTHALEERTVVQGTLLRVTIHLVAADDYWPMAIAIRDARRRWWLRAATKRTDEATVVVAAERVRAALDAQGQLSARDIERLVGQQAADGVGLWLDLVRVPPSGTWARRRADLFAAAEDWLGPPPALAADDAVDLLVRRYLGAFGPATPQEIAAWSGLGVKEVGPALARVALRRFRTDDGEQLVDLPRQPIPGPDAEVPVRFLSNWEALLLVHARRAAVLREDDRPRIFHTKLPQSLPTFLVDGQVAGTWRYHAGRIELDPFRPLAAAKRRLLEDEAERLAALFA
jgi:hypothetical protein